MSQKDRAQTVRTFSNDASVRIMLISLKWVINRNHNPIIWLPFLLPLSSLAMFSPALPCLDLRCLHFFSIFASFEPLIFVISFPSTPRAGGVGLNLTSASVVILLDPWWNPSTEDQAIDRYTTHAYMHAYSLTHTFTCLHTYAYSCMHTETHLDCV